MPWTDFRDDEGAFIVEGARIRVNISTGERWFTATCASCNGSSVWRGDKLVYPAGSGLPAPHPDMDADARAIYLEASAVYPHSRRASAALARAALEKLLRSIPGAPQGARLDELIAAVEPSVGKPLWQVLTALRHLGNTALHGDSDPQSVVALYLDGEGATAAEPYFSAMNALVEELVTQPAKAQAIYDMLPGGVRESAERKAQK